MQKPWGSYETLASGKTWWLKTLTVEPHQSLSLQTHRLRDEHWIILSGLASVTIGMKMEVYGRGEHVFVPSGTSHRLINIGSEPLVVAEIALGSCNEDDIVRLEDQYGRS